MAEVLPSLALRTATRPFFPTSTHPSTPFAFNIPYTFTVSYPKVNHTASLFGISSYTRGQLPTPIHSLERRLHRDSSLSTSLQPPEHFTMPIHRVKSLIRYQGPKKNTNHHNGGVAQRRPMRTVYSIVSSSTLVENVRGGELVFAKKSVRSIDELGDALRSNLSSSLDAVRAAIVQEDVTEYSPSPTCQHIERLQEEDGDPPESLLNLAPIYQPVDDHLEAAVADDVTNEEDIGAADGPSASLLAATAIYRPVNEHLEPQFPRAVVIESGVEDNQAPVSTSAPEDVTTPPEQYHERAQQSSASSPPAETCAIEDDDAEPPASLLLETQETLVDYIRNTIQSSKEPFRPQECRPSFLQRVLASFAGRCHFSNPIEEEPPKVPGSRRVQLSSTVPAPAFHEFSPYCPPPPPPRRATLPQAIPHKNLPRSPPVIAPCRPYLPIEENLKAPLIEPAKEHRYTGTYGVVRDVFQPAEVQIGFPSDAPPPGPASSTTTVSLTIAGWYKDPNARYLDRIGTVWGEWYAKTTKPQALPFARGHKEEVTEQQVWDAHSTVHEPWRRNPNKDRPQARNDKEQECAARLRHHPGHCYGALTGDVYPFQGGLII